MCVCAHACVCVCNFWYITVCKVNFVGFVKFVQCSEFRLC